MKRFYYLILFELIFITRINAQANLIQSIDFDSLGRTVYALTGNYDYSYVLRYDNGNLESWNISELFNIPFTWISTTIDKDGNICAYQETKLLKFDGISWTAFDIPTSPFYFTYSHIKEDDHNNIWLSALDNCQIHKLNLTDSTWKNYTIDHPNTQYCWAGEIVFKGDSTLICTNAGLTLIYNDSVSIILDTTNSSIPSQQLYSFYIDSKGNRWFGSYDKGLIEWINDSTFISYNTGNSNLPDNFINAIDEDSKGTLWMATDKGFASFNGDSITSYSYLYPFSTLSLAVDQDDKIWMGSWGDYPAKLLVFDGERINIITDVAEEYLQPGNFQLFQNYPNPFNPSTKIKYEITSQSFVTLKVFDILGRVVKTLINESKPAGIYETTFDAYNWSSGVYIYRITALNKNKILFSQSKQMLLLK